MRIALGLFFIGAAFASIGLMIRFFETGFIQPEVIVVNQLVVAVVAVKLGLKEFERHWRG